jgi:hypothetical protein
MQTILARKSQRLKAARRVRLCGAGGAVIFGHSGAMAGRQVSK